MYIVWESYFIMCFYIIYIIYITTRQRPPAVGVPPADTRCVYHLLERGAI